MKPRIILPASVVREAPRDPEVELRAKCPAARLGEYADSGRQFVYCGVERKHFPVAQSPAAVLGWCCSEYEACPVWRAERENDPVVARVHEAQERSAAREAERGLRSWSLEDEIDATEEELREERDRVVEDRKNGRVFKGD